MNAKLFNPSLIKYELRNLVGNVFSIIFGIISPIFMTVVLGPTIANSVPDVYKSEALTAMFIANSCMVPLAAVFIGYSATFSQEIEKNITLRFRLFGFKEKTIMASKIIAILIMTTLSLLIYSVVSYAALELEVPQLSSAVTLVIVLYALTILMFIIAHAIALILKKFATTYAVTLILYFAVMLLSGLMGTKVQSFSKGLQRISYNLPTTYLAQDFISFWKEGSYNFAPFIQSMILIAVIGILILIFAVYRDRREA